MVVTWQVVAIVVAVGDGGGVRNVWCCSQPRTDLESNRSTVYIAKISIRNNYFVSLMVNSAHILMPLGCGLSLSGSPRLSPGRVRQDYNSKVGPCHTDTVRNLSPAESGRLRRSRWGSVKSSN